MQTVLKPEGWEFKVLAIQLFVIMLNATLRHSESLGYFPAGHTYYPAQFCQLAEIKSWFPPPDRVFLSPSQQFVYFRTAGAKNKSAERLDAGGFFFDPFGPRRRLGRAGRAF